MNSGKKAKVYKGMKSREDNQYVEKCNKIHNITVSRHHSKVLEIKNRIKIHDNINKLIWNEIKEVKVF